MFCLAGPQLSFCHSSISSIILYLAQVQSASRIACVDTFQKTSCFFEVSTSSKPYLSFCISSTYVCDPHTLLNKNFKTVV